MNIYITKCWVPQELTPSLSFTSTQENSESPLGNLSWKDSKDPNSNCSSTNGPHFSEAHGQQSPMFLQQMQPWAGNKIAKESP